MDMVEAPPRIGVTASGCIGFLFRMLYWISLWMLSGFLFRMLYGKKRVGWRVMSPLLTRATCQPQFTPRALEVTDGRSTWPGDTDCIVKASVTTLLASRWLRPFRFQLSRVPGALRDNGYVDILPRPFALLEVAASQLPLTDPTEPVDRKGRFFFFFLFLHTSLATLVDHGG